MNSKQVMGAVLLVAAIPFALTGGGIVVSGLFVIFGFRYLMSGDDK